MKFKNKIYLLLSLLFISSICFSGIKNHKNFGFLTNCTESSPFDLYNSGSPSSVICGGLEGIDSRNMQALGIFINYTSTDGNTGIECFPQFSDLEFTFTNGNPIWTDSVTEFTTPGLISIDKLKIRNDNVTSTKFVFFIPVSYDRFRLICQAAHLDTASPPYAGVVSSGDTISVAIRGIEYD